MTRKNDDKRGNDEFGDYPEADYNRKVEARFTKELQAKQVQGKDTYPKNMNDSHCKDK